MNKINIKDIRLLHSLDHFYVINAGFGNVLDNTDLKHVFTEEELNRKNIHKAFKWRGIDTRSWDYWTDDAGILLLNK